MNQHTPIDIEKRIGQYVALRDKIKSIEERHKQELAPYKQALEQLNTLLLDHLNTVGVDSASAKGIGTCYRSLKRSATIADGAAFRRFVIGGEHWNLADWKANPKAVAEFIESHEGDAPPGINFSTHYTVGVRRA